MGNYQRQLDMTEIICDKKKLEERKALKTLLHTVPNLEMRTGQGLFGNPLKRTVGDRIRELPVLKKPEVISLVNMARDKLWMYAMKEPGKIARVNKSFSIVVDPRKKELKRRPLNGNRNVLLGNEEDIYNPRPVKPIAKKRKAAKLYLVRKLILNTLDRLDACSIPSRAYSKEIKNLQHVLKILEGEK